MSQTTGMTARVLALLLAIGSAEAQTQNAPSSLANAGTLTCTTSDAPQSAVADAELSCRFHALSGQDGNFTGYIARKGGADLPPGKRVLMWSVLAPSTDVALASLAGDYGGETGGQPSGRLIGGQGNLIVLRPVTITSQIGDTPVPTVLELRLEPARA
jgi:hypothetical protein